MPYPVQRHPVKKQCCKTMVLLLILWLGTALPVMGTTSQPGSVTPKDFPVYEAIKPNVAFWIKIFSQYNRSRGVIHDSLHLDRIFAVIDLDPALTVAAAKKNKRTKDAAFKKHKAVLLDLAGGKTPSNSLEKKVAALFGPDVDPAEYKQAAFRLRCQTGIADQFKAGLIRSGAVIEEFRRIFRSHGLPEDLVYLPCVESSFDFNAYSKFGAAGIWQFTRGTGKQFMEIGYVVDQRRDPYISADAAARLLKRNYAQLKNWPLAITAYNHGLAGMKRARQARGTYEKIFLHYTSRSFKFASRNFYPEFVAALQVAKNYQQYFGELQFDTPVNYTRFTTKGFLSARSFTRGVDMDIQDFHTLNPSLRSPVFKDQKYIPKGFDIRLPPHIALHHAQDIAFGLYQTKQKPSRFHVVAKGDTAGAIARTHNVSLNDLIMANSLGLQAVIFIGQNLRIPVREQPDDLPAAAILADQTAAPKTPAPDEPRQPGTQTIVRKITKPAQVKQPIALPKPAATSQPPVAKAIETPGPSQTLSGEVAALPASAANRVNPLVDTSNLKIQKIVDDNNARVGIIQVEAEETLGHYADWLNIPTSRIRSLNRLVFGTSISISQSIKIPLTAADPGRFEEKRFEFHREMEEDFFDSFMVSAVETYEIQPGDTIWSLCLKQLEIPFWLLKKYNPKTDFSAMHPGQTLKYPVVAGKKGNILL
ncbi:MAG: transglycosylase SLT domain-containing protein [Desulfotignum sp.]|nr:transglycosylase SLT domain-containing protein [Desulfobacteraceae bacterium]